MIKAMIEKIERTTVIAGILLALLGLAVYAYSGFTSATALIPLLPGGLLILLGLASCRERLRAPMLHIAAVVGLISFLPFFMGLPKVIGLLGGAAVERPLAAVEMTLMGLIALLYLAMAIRYFLARRRERKALER